MSRFSTTQRDVTPADYEHAQETEPAGHHVDSDTLHHPLTLDSATSAWTLTPCQYLSLGCIPSGSGKQGEKDEM